MLKIVQIGPNEFDLAFDDPSKNDEVAAVNTILAAVLNTDGEAPASREPDRYARRGWWNGKVGNDVWHVRRQPLSPAARKEAVFVVEQALKRYSAVLSNIKVTDVTSLVSSPTTVTLEISGTHQGTNFLHRMPL